MQFTLSKRTRLRMAIRLGILFVMGTVVSIYCSFASASVREGGLEFQPMHAANRRHLLNSTIEDKRLKNYPTDALSMEDIKNGGFVLYLLGMVYMFLALAIVCDEFFVPALELMESNWKIQPDVAGATLMAAGGSAPELATSFIGTFVSRSNVGFGTIIGSAVFNILFVIAFCAFFTDGSLKLTAWPLFRDSFYYVLSLSVLAVFYGASSKNEIELWEAIVLFLMYVMYVIYVYSGKHIQKLLSKCIPAFAVSEDDEAGDQVVIKGGKGISRAMSITSRDDVAAPGARVDNFGFPMRPRKYTTRSTILSLYPKQVTPLREKMARRSIDHGSFLTVAKEILSKQQGLNKEEYIDMVLTVDSTWSREELAKSFTLLDANHDGIVLGTEILNWLQGDPIVIEHLKIKVQTDLQTSLPDGHDRDVITQEQAALMLQNHGYIRCEKAFDDFSSSLEWSDTLEISKLKFVAWVAQRILSVWSNIDGDGGIGADIDTKMMNGNYRPDADVNGVGGSSGGETPSDTGTDSGVVNRAPAINVMDEEEKKGRESSTDQEIQARASRAVESIPISFGDGEEGTKNRDRSDTKGSVTSVYDEEDEDDDGPIQWPIFGSKGETLQTIFTGPLLLPMLLTCPDVRNETPGWFLGGILRTPQNKLFVLAFIMSIAWIAIFAYFMVWWTTVVGVAWDIPDEIMGLLFLAAGTSIPDLLTSVIVAQAGKGDMAVSSSIGSNVFDITFGLPVPWIFYTAINYPDSVDVTSGELELSIALLIAMVALVIVLIMYTNWTLNNTLGALMMAMYVAFLMQHLLRFYL